jgi:hypothetical protein
VLRPVAMRPGDYRIVANRLFELLRPPPPRKRRRETGRERHLGPLDVSIQYLRGEARHTPDLEARETRSPGGTPGRGCEVTSKAPSTGTRSVFGAPSYEESQLVYAFENALQRSNGRRASLASSQGALTAVRTT